MDDSDHIEINKKKKVKKTTKKPAKKIVKKSEKTFGMDIDLDDDELLNEPPPISTK